MTNIEQIYDASTLQHKVSGLAKQIESDLGGGDPWVISIVGGSVLFQADLIRSLSEPIRFDLVQVQYSVSAQTGDVLDIHYPIPLDVTGQTLVIIKDVVVSGVIETYLANQFRQKGAERVLFGALIDVPSGRTTDFEPDYALFKADRKQVFVGYGLKYQGRYGNLPYLGHVLEE